MGKFRITGPDGATYEITAPDGATEQDVLAFVQQNAQKATRSTGATGAAATVSGGILEGIPVVGPLIRGGLDRAGAAIGSVVHDIPYEKALENIQTHNAAAKKEYPVADAVSQFGGAVAGLAPVAMTGPGAAALGITGRGLLPRAGAGLASGVTIGGADSAVRSGGDVGQTSLGAGVTGLIGGLAPFAGSGIGAGARNLVNRFQSGRLANDLGMERPTYDLLTRAMQSDDSFTGAGLQRLRQAGPDAMLADAGPNARTILDTAIQRSGPAGRIARDAIEARAANANDQITGALDNALGEPFGINTVEGGLRRGTARARAEAYDAAYSQPIDYSSETGRQLETIMQRRVPNSAIRAANNLIRTEGGHVPQIMVRVGDDGAVTFQRMPTVAQLDYITRGLNEVADRANGQGALGGTTQLGRAYGNLSREIRGLVRQAVPEYATALDTAAQPIQARNALQFGRDLLSPRLATDEAVETINGMSGAERMYAAQGVRSNIEEALSNVKRAIMDPNVDAREAVKVVKDLSSRAARGKVEALIGQQQAAQLFEQMNRAAMALDLRAGVATNSRTFARLSMDDAIRNQTEAGPLNALREGRPVNAGRSLLQTITGRTPEAKERIADGVYTQLVQQLTGPRGADALRMLQLMQGRTPLIQNNANQAARDAAFISQLGLLGTPPAIGLGK